MKERKKTERMERETVRREKGESDAGQGGNG